MPEMNRIRDGIHALLSRSSRKRSRSDAATTAGRKQQDQSLPRSGGGRDSTKNVGFNVVQARVYTKGEKNNYHYSPIPAVKLPTFRVDPPDDIPFQLDVTEQLHHDACDATPPPSPTLNKSWNPPLALTIDTKQVVSLNSAPPSPPSSPDTEVSRIRKSLSFSELKYQSPTRAPPSPPATPLSPPGSPLLDASDDILIHIFSFLDSLPSMGALARSHPRFNTVLSQNKLFILRRVVRNFSSSAAYLVELLKPGEVYEAKSYLESYVFSLEVVHTIKSLIQSRCRFFLARGKMDFQNDRAEKAFDDALYNIWAFCVLFRDRTDKIERQMKWLRRFGSRELLDMLEIWQCLGVLLRPLADCSKLALKYGIIQSRPPTSNNTKFILELEEWISYVQTRGLENLLPIVEWAEKEHTQRYTIVVGKGLHKWKRQQKIPYSLFLKDAASKVYGELLLAKQLKHGEVPPSEVWGPTNDF